mgnify:CR=1 FL=1
MQQPTHAQFLRVFYILHHTYNTGERTLYSIMDVTSSVIFKQLLTRLHLWLSLPTSPRNIWKLGNSYSVLTVSVSMLTQPGDILQGTNLCPSDWMCPWHATDEFYKHLAYCLMARPGHLMSPSWRVWYTFHLTHKQSFIWTCAATV